MSEWKNCNDCNYRLSTDRNNLCLLDPIPGVHIKLKHNLENGNCKDFKPIPNKDSDHWNNSKY